MQVYCHPSVRGHCVLWRFFLAFFDDIQKLVTDSVCGDIAHCISLAQSPEDTAAANTCAKERESFLKKWLKLDRPLSYGQNYHTETYQSLVQAVVSYHRDISAGLPNLEEHAMSPTTFVELLLKMSSSTSPSSIRAPIMANGSFLLILREAHSCLLVLSQETDETAQNSFLSKLFLLQVKNLRICFVPSHLSRSGHPGAPFRLPLFNSWAQLSHREPITTNSLRLHHSQNLPSSSRDAAAIALSNALTMDSNAEWFAN
jgi:hypothetical protein